MRTQTRMTALACCAALALAGTAQAAGPKQRTHGHQGGGSDRSAVVAGGQNAAPAPHHAKRQAERALALLERPGRTFHRAVELGALELRYRELLGEARGLGVAPKHHLLDERVATQGQLRRGARRLRERIERERRERRRERRERRQAQRAAQAAGAGATQAVSDGFAPSEASAGASGTLESIAQCESGGDPGAVNPAGYYGKYQFDLGTWQSVGGSGNPASASEAEQDYRAQLLYERSGASPWPVCGG